jgi:hypothetical protein
VTFRDFAGAIMQGDVGTASGHLEVLLDLDAPAATAAAGHFKSQMDEAGPPFMMKAMGLRTAVTGGSDDDISALLVELFGFASQDVAGPVAKLRETYAGQ